MLNESLNYISHNYNNPFSLKIYRNYYNGVSLKRHVKVMKKLEEPITLATYVYDSSYWNYHYPYNNYDSFREARADTVFKRIWYIAKHLDHIGKFSKYNKNNQRESSYDKQRRRK